MRRPQYRGYDDVAEPPKAYQAAQARRSRLMPKTVGRRKMHPVEGQVPQRNSPCRFSESAALPLRGTFGTKLFKRVGRCASPRDDDHVMLRILSGTGS